MSSKRETLGTPQEIEFCTLRDLKVGDKVRIEHAHKYENGYWQCWVVQDYRFIGFIDKNYRFEHLKHTTTHFYMPNNSEPSHNFLGRIKEWIK